MRSTVRREMRMKLRGTRAVQQAEGSGCGAGLGGQGATAHEGKRGAAEGAGRQGRTTAAAILWNKACGMSQLLHMAHRSLNLSQSTPSVTSGSRPAPGTKLRPGRCRTSPPSGVAASPPPPAATSGPPAPISSGRWLTAAEETTSSPSQKGSCTESAWLLRCAAARFSASSSHAE